MKSERVEEKKGKNKQLCSPFKQEILQQICEIKSFWFLENSQLKSFLIFFRMYEQKPVIFLLLKRQKKKHYNVFQMLKV